MENKENTPGAGATRSTLRRILASSIEPGKYQPFAIRLGEDFGNVCRHQNARSWTDRMSPVGTMLYAKALNETLARYEATFGRSACGDPSLATIFSSRSNRLMRRRISDYG